MPSQACQKAGPQNASTVERAEPGAPVLSASPNGVSANRCPSRSVRMPRPASVRINRCSDGACVPVGPASSAALFAPPARWSASPSFAAA